MMRNNTYKKTLVLGIIVLFIGMSITTSSGTKVVKKSTPPLSNGYIQDLIDNASDGDTLYIPSGIYYENIVINKSINLIGEDKETTIIDGGDIGSVIRLNYMSSEVTISGFTIQNSGEDWVWQYAGIEIESPSNNITGNIIRNNPHHGISIGFEDSNDINQNIITDNLWGITLEESFLNNVYENYITNNWAGIYLYYELPTNNDKFSPSCREPLYLDTDINYIFRNNLKNNVVGIRIEPNHNTYIFENSILENNVGIGLYNQPTEYSACMGNHIYKNNITKNRNGIKFSQIKTTVISNNEIYLNDITNNILGVSLTGRDVIKDNKIYQNNFKNNRINACDRGENIWEENYWDNWIGNKIKLPIFQRFPKMIFGLFKLNFDWNPASEPYDIEV